MAKFKMNTTKLIDGGIAGGITPFAERFAGDLGPAVAMGAVGAWRNNDALQTLAGYSLGSRLIAGNVAGAGGASEGGFL